MAPAVGILLTKIGAFATLGAVGGYAAAAGVFSLGAAVIGAAVVAGAVALEFCVRIACKAPLRSDLKAEADWLSIT